MRVVLVGLIVLLGSIGAAQQKQSVPNLFMGYSVDFKSPKFATTRTFLRETGAKGDVSPDDGTVYGIIFHPSFPEGIVGGDPATYEGSGEKRKWTITWQMAPTGSGLILRVRTHQTPHGSHDEPLQIADPPPTAKTNEQVRKLSTDLIDLGDLFKSSIPRPPIGVEITKFYKDGERGESVWVAKGQVTQGARPVLGYMIRLADSQFINGRCRSQGPHWVFEFHDPEPGKYYLTVESTCGVGFDSRIVTIR